MIKQMMNTAMHISEAEMLQRSRWYGPNLLTVITDASETNGAFGIVRNLMRKGFEPPLHVHTREDESNYVLDGEIVFAVGDEKIYARKGDFIFLPRNVPHTFQIISDTAETLLLITPGGFETMFVECSRPAASLELPPLSGKPPKEFFEKIREVSERLGASFLPSF